MGNSGPLENTVFTMPLFLPYTNVPFAFSTGLFLAILQITAIPLDYTTPFVFVFILLKHCADGFTIYKPHLCHRR